MRGRIHACGKQNKCSGAVWLKTDRTLSGPSVNSFLHEGIQYQHCNSMYCIHLLAYISWHTLSSDVTQLHPERFHAHKHAPPGGSIRSYSSEVFIFNEKLFKAKYHASPSEYSHILFLIIIHIHLVPNAAAWLLSWTCGNISYRHPSCF